VPATNVLLRRRVVERFVSATDAPITAIIAPAGYGKSTALRQFVQDRRDPTILFGVRPDDDSLVAFARGLIQSSPTLSQEALSTLQDAYTLAAQSADPGKVLANWLAIFVNDLPTTALIAIDDMQFGYVDPHIPHFVTALIDQTKQRIHWLLSSRSWQNLPIDSWVAQGDMELPIDEVDLEFTADDVRELAALTSSATSPDPEVLQRLTSQLGPIALVLTLRTEISLDNLVRTVESSDSSEEQFSKLADRLFDALTEHERTFLKVASLLRSIDEDLFVAAGVSDVRQLSERFAAAGVLVPYGTDGSALRIHDLFTQQIERRLIDKTPHDSWRVVAKRICLLLDGRGKLNAAIALCLKLHDAHLANDIVRRRGLMFWDELNGELLDKTVALIQSDPGFKPDPVFRAVQGMHVFRSGNVAEGKRQLIAALTRITDPVTRSRIGARLTIGSMMSGTVPEGVQPFMFDVKHVEEAGALSEIAGALALVLGAKGKYREVRDLIDRTIQRLSTMPGGDVALLHFQQWAGFACWIVGDFEECRAFERRAVRDGIASGRPAVSVFGYTLLISIGLAFGDDLDELYQYAEDRREQERRAGYVGANGVSKLQALVCAVAAGDDATCSAMEHELQRETSEITRIFVEQASKELALRDAWNGKFSDAVARISATSDKLSQHLEVVRLYAIAMYSAAAGDRNGASAAAKAAGKLMGSIPWFQNKGHQMIRNLAGVYEALALMILGEDDRAHTRLATLNGFTGPLVGGMKLVAEGFAGRDSSRVDQGLAMIQNRQYLGYARMLEQVGRQITHKRAAGGRVKTARR